MVSRERKNRDYGLLLPSLGTRNLAAGLATGAFGDVCFVAGAGAAGLIKGFVCAGGVFLLSASNSTNGVNSCFRKLIVHAICSTLIKTQW